MNILNKLTIKHLVMNKKRTIVTIIGVVLSTALMVGIGLIFSSVRENMIKEIIEYNGSYHVEYQNIEYGQKMLLQNNTAVKKVFYAHELGYAYLEGGTNEYKPYLHVLEVNDEYYDELHFISGRKPVNDEEIVISNHIKSNGGVSYRLGDTITLSIGDRYYPEENGETYPIEHGEPFVEGETLQTHTTKTYTIVGIVERSCYENYDEPGYSVFVNEGTLTDDDVIYSYVIFKSTKNIYNKAYTIAENLGKEKEESFGYTYYSDVQMNDALLSLYGESQYSNINSGMFQIIVIVLSIISVGCIIVIYNSFAISVMERKKQFGLFSSIGATKKQIRKTVFFEAFIIAIIGIPLGILGAYLGIGIVIQIVNYLVPKLLGSDLVLTTYPPLILIPILFMIIVIFLSAYLPAVRASRVTPIESIRQNDDIKIKSKKVKTGKWVSKLFGIEGEIALKNIKRNKKKYRITIASLFISIVMFVSFSSLLQYGLRTSEDFLTLPDYNIEIYYHDEDEEIEKHFEEEMAAYEGVEKIVYYQSHRVSTPTLDDSYFTKEGMNHRESISIASREYEDINLIRVDDKYYQDLLNKNHRSAGTAFFINLYKGISYANGERVNYEYKWLDKTPSSLSICNLEYDYEQEVIVGEEWSSYPIKDSHCNASLNNIVTLDTAPFGMSSLIQDTSSLNILVSEDMYDQIISQITYEEEGYYGNTMLIQASDYEALNKRLEEIEDTNELTHFDFTNIEKDMQLERNMILVIKILLYGFISLVTLIGVTSVFNTINTSIALRRKEFAMLRSMGLTPGGFNKIICFESLFFGMKSLLYALPFSCLVIIWIHMSIGNIVSYSDIMWPWNAFLIAIVGVFLIVFATMIYATKKVKRENILDSIREENI